MELSRCVLPDPMRVLAVNRGRRSRQTGARGFTGIGKTPIQGPATIATEGVDGDQVCDRRYHGGPDQALYVYGGGDIEWWEANDQRRYPPGSFGENLLISGLETGTLAVGDILVVGAVRLQVTDARIPCRTLERHLDEPGFAKRFSAALRPGAYCRVLLPGIVETGDPVSLEPWGGTKLTLAQIVLDNSQTNRDTAEIKRFLDLPISERLRAKKERQLHDIG